MHIMRRLSSKLLRTRNIVLLTILFMFLYILKMFINLQPFSEVLPLKSALRKLVNNDQKEFFVPRSLKKIDWHNYTQMQMDMKRTGLGEQGEPAYMKDSKHVQALYSVNGFNGALSDKIALNRSLKDLRHPGCRVRLYIESLPTVSVVVPFHNEHWSTLLRTVYSVINRSPPQLLKEIFLVDDASTKPFLKKDLFQYVSQKLPKVSIVRLRTRSGLITARLAGAKKATGDVIVFLDSHTEATTNWLPPLLEPIALDYRTVMCPYIDVIDHDTFEYRPQDEGSRGAFDWTFAYKRLPLLPQDERNMPEPFKSPVMAGGLFAMSRVFFWQLGGYDPGLDIWGGEQYELSFKVWQCGGQMFDAPCSRVGHIYRKTAPFPDPHHGDFLAKNYRRVAEVWMDEYAQYLYNRRPHYALVHPGPLDEQRALRARLKCRPFRWFLTQVAFDLPAKYPLYEPDNFAEGRVRPVQHPQLCVDAHHGNQMDSLLLRACVEHSSAEQRFMFTWHKDIRSKTRDMCWDLPDATPMRPVKLIECHLGGGNQLWRYHLEDKTIRQGVDLKCLDFDIPTRNLFINDCAAGAETQQWTVDTVNHQMMAKWEKTNQPITGPVPLNYFE